MFRPRAILSVIGVFVGAAPGVVYYAIDMTGPLGSLVLAALGGFIGLALTLPGVSVRRVVHTTAQMTPLFLPVAWLVGPPDEESVTPTQPTIVPEDSSPKLLDRRWLTPVVVELARFIRDRDAFHLLPILGDALTDAGCDDERILGHCHDWNSQANKRWVVDLVLVTEADTRPTGGLRRCSTGVPEDLPPTGASPVQNDGSGDHIVQQS